MKLNDIQQKLKAPKSQYNSFGKYHYRNAEDILEAVKPLLGDSMLTLSDEIVNVGDRYYVKATACISWREDGDGVTIFTVTAYAREAFDRKGMDDSQITGVASSYARKYALNGLFLIDDTKDADHDEGAANVALAPGPQSSHKPRIIEAKPAATTKDADTELKAAKDRLVTLLKMLGHNDLKTRKQYEDAVFDLTGYILADKDIEAINEKLGALVEKADADK
jgi:hypothetical protein